MKLVWGNFNNPMINPFAQYYTKSFFPSFPAGLPLPTEEEIKIIGKDEFYRNKVANLIKVNEALGTFNNENNKPASFFENPDFQRLDPSPEKPLKLNCNLFDFSLINNQPAHKRVHYKKHARMSRPPPLTPPTLEKVIPFIGSNVDNLLLLAQKTPAAAAEDLLDCDALLPAAAAGPKKIVIGHKRTKTLYKLNKSLKVDFFAFLAVFRAF